MLYRAHARQCVCATAKLTKKQKKIKYKVRCRQLNHLANLRLKQNIEGKKKLKVDAVVATLSKSSILLRTATACCCCCFFFFFVFFCVFYFFDYSVVTAVARAVAKRRDTAHVRSSPPGRSSFRNPEISKLLLLNFSLVRFHFCLIFHALYSPQRTRTKATLVGDKSHTLLFLAFCFFLFLLSYRRHEHLGP